MAKLLAGYRNGNYRVLLFEDGTKIKQTEAECFSADFPDSIDLKITDHCENNCPMCHERSSASGRHGDLHHRVIESFPCGMEVAIGGGNPLSHPDLLPFLERLKSKKIIANLTVSAFDLERQRALLEELIRRRLVYGVGVSCLAYDDLALDFALAHPNVVLHLINGVFCPSDFRKLMGKPLKILILGYKNVGRGKDFFSPAVRERMQETERMTEELLAAFETISFDNLALEQLAVKDKIGEERFAKIYMGADGEASMYVDLVREECALSSASEERFPLGDSLREAFHHLPRAGE